MRGQQHRTALTIQPGDELPQRLAQLDVDTRGRFVQHDHLRAMHQRLRHQHATLHTARELAHIDIGFVGQAEVFQQLVDPVIIAMNAEIAALDPHQFAHIEERIEDQFLRHDAQGAAGFGIVAHDIMAQHRHLPTAGLSQTGEDADQAGLAGTVGAQQTEKFALGNVETDAIEGPNLA